MNDDEIQLILDRQSIRDTLHRQAVYVDEGNLSGLAEVWAPDSRRDNGAGRSEVVGFDAMASRLARMLAMFRWTHHQLGESLIEIDGDKATALTYSTNWHEMLSGERHWATVRYYDELRRGDDGRWLISFRRLILTGADGMEHDGAWLERQLPTDIGK